MKQILKYLMSLEPKQINEHTVKLVLNAMRDSTAPKKSDNIAKAAISSIMNSNKQIKKAIFLEGLNFLWKCVEDIPKLNIGAVNSTLSSLSVFTENLDERLEVVSLFLQSFKAGTCKSQHYIVLHNLLSKSSKKSGFLGMSSSTEFDKILDRVFNDFPFFCTTLVQDFKTRVESELVEDHFTEEQIFGTRMNIIVTLIFMTKIRQDTKDAFEMMIAYLTQDSSKGKFFE